MKELAKVKGFKESSWLGLAELDYLRMCRLKFWLQEIHKIHICVEYFDTIDSYSVHVKWAGQNKEIICEENDTYQQALESGCESALETL